MAAASMIDSRIKPQTFALTASDFTIRLTGVSALIFRGWEEGNRTRHSQHSNQNSWLGCLIKKKSLGKGQQCRYTGTNVRDM